MSDYMERQTMLQKQARRSKCSAYEDLLSDFYYEKLSSKEPEYRSNRIGNRLMVFDTDTLEYAENRVKFHMMLAGCDDSYWEQYGGRKGWRSRRRK